MIVLLGKGSFALQQEEQLIVAEHCSNRLIGAIPDGFVDAAHSEHCLVEQIAVGIGLVLDRTISYSFQCHIHRLRIVIFIISYLSAGFKVL